MRHYSRLFLLLSLTTVFSLRAQRPSFRIFTTQDGLVRNWVTKIHRDSKGFLWFCTVEGISLFDGYRFTNFSTKDGLPSRLVNDMIETRQGEYWFATEAGLARFHTNHGDAPAFDVIRVGTGNESNNVDSLYEGHDGTIWCGTNVGLYSLPPKDGKPSPRFIPLDGPDHADVRSLAEDSHQNLWIATPSGLIRRRPSGEIESLAVSLPQQRINSMVVDADGRLWAGGFGLMGIDTNTVPPRVLPSEEVPKIAGLINVLYRGEGGELWIGGSTGLVRFRPDASPPEVLTYPPSDAFPIQNVLALGQDVRHNLWLGVATLGVVRIAAGPFELFTKADGLDSTEVVGLV